MPSKARKKGLSSVNICNSNFQEKEFLAKQKNEKANNPTNMKHEQ
jgi:hypothetical protein